MDAFKIATHIVQQLVQAGYTAYFAGGWVRDYLMGHPSSDIDIATDAPPQKILDIFPNTIHVGIAFGVVIVSMQGKQFEVSTFRKDFEYEGGRRPTRIEPATPQEDAQRRDFTINGMFYDPLTEVIHDYVHGKEDLEKQVIRAIGDPYERFSEDRLRMIRAIRFSARFGFKMDPDTQEAIAEYSDTLLPAVSMERVWHELQKMAKNPNFEYAIIEMHRLGLLPTIFPVLQKIHLNDIKSYISSYSYFPKEAPTVAYLMELFPYQSKGECTDICRSLRTSNQDIKFVELLFETKELLKQEKEGSSLPEEYTWSHFYAHPHAWTSLEIQAARYPENERQELLHRHQRRIQRLHRHIERIQKKQPLVTSAHLKKAGVLPGIEMGRLLKEAERLSMNHNIEDPDEIIAKILHS